MSERRAKRPKISRGEDDFLPGNIIEIELQNLMTFNQLVCKPGSRLNLVIGPNGSGRASSCTAISVTVRSLGKRANAETRRTFHSTKMINPSMYGSQWFITVFSYSFPFPTALRIWDVFLAEGVKFVFKVGLTLLKYCHDDLVKLPFEELMHALRNFPEDAMDPDSLLPLAYSIKVPKRLEEMKQDSERAVPKPTQTTNPVQL